MKIDVYAWFCGIGLFIWGLLAFDIVKIIIGIIIFLIGFAIFYVKENTGYVSYKLKRALKTIVGLSFFFAIGLFLYGIFTLNIYKIIISIGVYLAGYLYAKNTK